MTVTVLVENGVDFWAVGAVVLGLLLDLTLGSLAGKPSAEHLLRPLAGLAERGVRRVLARQRGPSGTAELIAGLILAVVVIGFVGGLVWLVVDLLDQLGGPATLIGRGLLIAWGLSLGRLGGEAVRASEAVDLPSARRLASNFAGLAAARLDQAGIRRACVEGVGARICRQAIGPLFWIAIGGPVGLWAYLAIGALADTVVVGPRSRYLGFAAARLDDLANFAPARLGWLLLALSAALLGEEAGAAFRSGLAEGRRHPDRPSAWGAGTLLGALGFRAGAIGVGRDDPSTVRRAVRIARVAALHAASLAIAYRIVVLGG